MDKYIDGYIYLNVKFINRPSQMLYDKAYPCPQPHPFKDGDDVTGRYMVASDGSAFQLYQAKPIHSGEPTAKEEKDSFIEALKKGIPVGDSSEEKEQGDDWVRVCELITGCVDRLVELRKYHINPYNLGDEGEVSSQITTLSQLVKKLPKH